MKTPVKKCRIAKMVEQPFKTENLTSIIFS